MDSIKFILSKSGRPYLFLLSVWGMLILNFGAGAIDQISFLSPISHLFRPIVIGLLALMSYNTISKCYRSFDILFYIVCALVFLMNYLLFPENESFMDDYSGKFLIQSLPYFYFGIAFDIKKCYKPFYICSVVCIAVQCLYSFAIEQVTHGSMDENELTSQMSTAYAVLPHVIMVTWHSLRSFKWFNLIPTVTGFFLLLSLGNRGSLVCALLFIFIYTLVVNKGKNRLVLLIFLFMIGYVLYSRFLEVMFGLQGLFSSMGMSTRLADLLVEKEYLSDNSALVRIDIINTLLDAIKNGGPLGYGIGADHRLSGEAYSHNLFLEWFVSFGILGGLILTLIFIRLLVSSYRSDKGIVSRSFWLLLFSTSVIQLMMSHTYLFCPEFFLFLGYCVSLKRGNQLPIPVWDEVKED